MKEVTLANYKQDKFHGAVTQAMEVVLEKQGYQVLQVGRAKAGSGLVATLRQSETQTIEKKRQRCGVVGPHYQKPNCIISHCATGCRESVRIRTWGLS
jgi:hypothetical protein